MSSRYCLGLRFSSLSQSSGTEGARTLRDTEMFTTKSQVVGMIQHAWGASTYDGTGPVDMPSAEELCDLRMAVRVDRPGIKAVDFHTIGNQRAPIRTAEGVWKAHGNAVIREYERTARNPWHTRRPLSAALLHKCSRQGWPVDVVFLEGSEEQRELLCCINEVMKHPRNVLFCGRRTFVPYEPFVIMEEPVEGTIEDMLFQLPLQVDEASDKIRVVMDAEFDDHNMRIRDIPLKWAHPFRSFGVRLAKDMYIDAAAIACESTL